MWLLIVSIWVSSRRGTKTVARCCDESLILDALHFRLGLDFDLEPRRIDNQSTASISIRPQ